MAYMATLEGRPGVHFVGTEDPCWCGAYHVDFNPPGPDRPPGWHVASVFVTTRGGR